MRSWMLFLLLACSCHTTHAREFCEPSCDGIPARTFSAKVIAVLDGDTVLVKRASGPLKIRLAEIDAPEVDHAGPGGQPPDPQKSQAFGEASKQALSGMVLGKQVRVTGQAIDQYGRMVAHLSIDSLDINGEQIRRGMAWEYSNFHSNKTLIALQQEASNASRGLWAQGNPTPPWVWRKQHPGTAPAHALASSSGTRATPVAPASGCGSKKRCAEMSSCAEARDYFSRCGMSSLDGDGDGTPCENLCGPQNKSRSP